MVVDLRYCVAAPCPPVRIFIASVKLMLEIALLKMGRAWFIAFSAPEFMASMVLSSSLPMAALRSALLLIFCSRLRISSGRRIL